MVLLVRNEKNNLDIASSAGAVENFHSSCAGRRGQSSPLKTLQCNRRIVKAPGVKKGAQQSVKN
jgi:hypothetical protein